MDAGVAKAVWWEGRLCEWSVRGKVGANDEVDGENAHKWANVAMMKDFIVMAVRETMLS